MTYVKNSNEKNSSDVGTLPGSASGRASKHTSIAVAIALALGSSQVMAEDLYQQAERQVQAGDITGMSATYLKILAQKPGDIRAQLGYATAQSWLGNHAEAQTYFNEVLRREPNNLEALTGLGYSHAWAKQYFDAEQEFNKAIAVAPNNLGAQKGLAYTYLWSGQPERARMLLTDLNAQHPEDAEILAALGQSQQALGMDGAATVSYEDALKIDPRRQDAKDGLAAIQQKVSGAEPSKGKVELMASFGSTSNGGASGLREFFAGYTPNERSRLWIRYDDSLSLDNPALARSNEDAQTIFLGFQNLINPQWLAVAEIGTRDLPNNADQQIYKVEGVNLRPQQTTLKMGLQISPHSEDFTDKLVYGAWGFQANESWRLEPTIYLSSSGALDDKEWRAVLFGEYRSDQRWTAGLGAGLGQISSDLAAADGSVTTANAIFTYPVSDRLRLSASVRYEDTPSNSITTTLLGIAVQLQ